MAGENHTVLVVDDDASIRAALSIALQDEGYQTVEAGDGAAALARLRSGPRPAVVVLDLMMPEMSGDEMLEALRRDPALADIPVVVLSGDARARAKAAALGATGFLAKPVELDDLIALVQRHATRLPPA